MKISTCTLELLRHGRRDDQLLSPFTPYLAFCESNEEVEPASVTIEHYQMLRRLRQIRYRDNRPATTEQLNDAAEPPTRLLASLGSFQQAFGRAAAEAGAHGLVHVHLVLSAAELELLPFELAQDRNRTYLALRPGAPVVFTRQVRGAVPREVRVAPPRILFITASRPNAWIPPELVLLHAAALTRALSPWLVSSDTREYDRHISVVQQATRQSIVKVFQLAAQERLPYTHVHVLAHGVEAKDPETEQHRYNVALADEDMVGADFALLLAGNEHLCPALVTLATCDGGAQGSVIGSGASVGHHLHKMGVPLVVASQFPLTHEGSVILTECLYEHLLQGHDPRVALRDLRQRLAPAITYHDWASVIAYASFPADEAERTRDIEQKLARTAVEAAATRMDRAEKGSADRDVAVTKLREAFGRLERLVSADAHADARDRARTDAHADPRDRARAVGLLGLLANAKKRTAEIMWRKGEDSRGMLQEAREHYRNAFLLDMNETWAEVQQLSLSVVLGAPLRLDDWTMVHHLASKNAQSIDPRDVTRQIWAFDNLVELYVLAQCLGEHRPPGVDLSAQARNQVEALLNFVRRLQLPSAPREAYSLLRQLKRYETWWWKDDPRAKLPAELVRMLVDGKVPETWGGIG